MVSEYKKTPLGFLPQSWKVKKLRDVATRITEKNKDRTDNVLTISAKFGLVNQKEFFNKSVASKNLSGYYYLQKGDFAYNKSYSEGYPFGAIKMLERYDQGIVSTLYICFRLTGNNTDSLFYKYYFDSNLWNEEVRLIAKEGGRSHGLLNVGVDEFFDILLPLPPLEEQSKIAAILSSVDEAIEKTEAIIEQTEKVKKGLMQQLLTKGIGHTKFKKTEIGEIPEEWEVKTLGELLKLKGGFAFKSSDFVEKGDIPVLRISNIKNNYIDLSDAVYVTNEVANSLNEYLLRENDIVIAMSGATTGKIGRIEKKDIPVLLNQRVGLFKIYQESTLSNDFLYYFAQSKHFQSSVGLNAIGGAQPNISGKQIESVKIGLPSFEEQQQISLILSNIDKKLANEEQRLIQFQAIKKGLMQVLLTGKVRVKVDDEVVSS